MSTFITPLVRIPGTEKGDTAAPGQVNYMPIKIEPTDNEELTRITLIGTVTVHELLEALDAYGRRGTTRLEIYDISELDGDRFSTGDIDILVDYLTGLDRRPANGKTAIVAARTVDIGITRMISMLSSGEVSYQIEAFRNVKEAMDWLSR